MIYLEAGFEEIKKIGESKVMILTEQDHIKRYELVADDIKLIQQILGKNKSNIEITKEGYILKFEFPIFLAK